MRTLICLLLPALLGALEPAPVPGLALELQSELGRDPLAAIRLVPPGCWDALVQGSPLARTPPARPRSGEATVEVWDVASQLSLRSETFGFYLSNLRARLSRALAVPPPKHQAIELSEIMFSDPGNPQKLDLIKVKSLQERFNRLPPNGSPVK